MGASGGAWPMDPAIAVPTYFLPQGISADLIATKYGFSRDDVDAYAVESQKRSKASWDAGNFKNSVIAGEGHQRHHDPRQGRAHASDHDDAVARRSCSRRSCRWARCTASTRSRCRRYPEVEIVHARASRRQFVRHRRRRGRRADRQQGSRREDRQEAARAHPGVRQYRLRARDHAHRPDRRDGEGAARRPA